MLWSLIKIVVFVALVALVTWAAATLIEMPGGAVVQFGGIEMTLSPLAVVVAILLIGLAVWIAVKLLGLLVALLRFIAGDETAFTRYVARSRRRKGTEALENGLLALAAGEGTQAMAEARRAERYLHRPEVTNLLIAQGAEQAGDRKTAEDAYKSLMQADRTRFVGLRGLMKQKLAEGDTDGALRLARTAFEANPRHGETQDTLLRLQAETGDWSGARETLGAKLRGGSLPRDVHRRRDAVLALSEARGVLEEGASIEAREKAIEANRKSPDLVPAAVMAARGYIETGNPRYAGRVLRKTWEVEPHPDLAATFADIAPNEDAKTRLKRFEVLTKTRPDHPETRMLKAELLIAAEDFNEARRALGDLIETDPTVRSVTLMAAIERGRGADDAVVRAWLARAISARRGPQWTCENCHTIQAEWHAVCPNCHAFDTLAWTRPPEGEVTMPGGADMLPLLVGKGPNEAPQPGPPVRTDGRAEPVPEAEVVADEAPEKRT
ncbi:heme biosynthesis protein HemY [Pseudoroseicyclus aestuarii]|uniref:HemY protein n=1 Tax=Pseudoroseicyclus aestuarii TaxID=1795041 RepID=A0A318ST25_9RHOB|nr:heme biosynthesis HemY N-terminal domain-containing protein [Pseudoroseicyclus aestuarii]PYE84622.1 HemY protein [Pseudoroseicyclus aestuarii]